MYNGGSWEELVLEIFITDLHVNMLSKMWKDGTEFNKASDMGSTMVDKIPCWK